MCAEQHGGAGGTALSGTVVAVIATVALGTANLALFRRLFEAVHLGGVGAIISAVEGPIKKRHRVNLPEAKTVSEGNYAVVGSAGAVILSFMQIVYGATKPLNAMCYVLWSGFGAISLMVLWPLSKARFGLRKSKTALEKNKWAFSIVPSCICLAWSTVVARLPSTNANTPPMNLDSLLDPAVASQQLSLNNVAALSISALVLLFVDKTIPLVFWWCRPCCTFTLRHCATEERSRALCISFAGHVLGWSAILSAIFGRGSAFQSIDIQGRVAAHVNATHDVGHGLAEGAIELVVCCMPQLAWLLISMVLIIVTQLVHAPFLAWHATRTLSFADCNTLERLREGNVAVAWRDAAMRCSSSLIIAAVASKRSTSLSTEDLGLAGLFLVSGEACLCGYSAVSLWVSGRSRSPRSVTGSSRSRELEANSHPDHIGRALNLYAWAMLLSRAIEVSGSLLVLGFWAGSGCFLLLATQKIAMSLILQDFKEMADAEKDRDPLESTTENWGAGMVGGAVSIVISASLCRCI